MNEKVYGKVIDGHTRCIHYHANNDIIAIKFKCCEKYYPCHACHDECSNHQAMVWPKSEFDQKAILCGNCKEELTIKEYLDCGSKCPKCNASFNPKCELHYSKYFDFM